MQRIVVTHFSGFLGFQLSQQYHGKDVVIDGVDQFFPGGFRRAHFASGSYQSWLDRQSPGFMHYELDLAHPHAVMDLIREIRPSAIVHSPPPASLPAPHDASFLTGTRNLLEAAKEFCWLSPFVVLSPRSIFTDHQDAVEGANVQGTGATSAAERLVQEYGSKYELPTCILRAPVPTDPWNPDGPLYDPLAALIQAGIQGDLYVISKQGLNRVRHAIHARDVAHFIELFCAYPRKGEIYYLGGEQETSYRIRDVLPIIAEKLGQSVNMTLRETPESVDRGAPPSDLRKAHHHYPLWRLSYSLDQMIDELIEAGSPLPN